MVKRIVEADLSVAVPGMGKDHFMLATWFHTVQFNDAYGMYEVQGGAGGGGGYRPEDSWVRTQDLFVANFMLLPKRGVRNRFFVYQPGGTALAVHGHIQKLNVGG